MSYSNEMNRMLTSELPHLKAAYETNVSWQDGDDTGAHVVYGDVLAPAIKDSIKGRDRNALRGYSNFIEKVLEIDDDDMYNVIALSVIESLMDLDGPDRAIAFDILGPKGREVWLDIERYYIDNADAIRAWNAAQPTKKLPWE